MTHIDPLGIAEYRVTCETNARRELDCCRRLMAIPVAATRPITFTCPNCEVRWTWDQGTWTVALGIAGKDCPQCGWGEDCVCDKPTARNDGQGATND